MEEKGQDDFEATRREVYCCKICGGFARQPVLNVICSHLFCWRCLYRDIELNRRKGLPQECPLCDSHIAISGLNSTIIRVCSGPQRGAVSCPEFVHYENMEMAKVVEEKLKMKGAPPRPSYHDSSPYSSPNVLICHLLNKCSSEVMDICELLDALCNDYGFDLRECVDAIRNIIFGMFRIVEDGALWFKGQKGSETGNTNGAHKKNGAMKKVKQTHFKGELKMIKRPVIKLKLSCQYFHRQKPRRNSLIRTQKYLVHLHEQPADLKSFSCTICGEPAYEPVVSKSGHLFCWVCLNSKGEFPTVDCPITKLFINLVSSQITVSPIYNGVEYEAEDGLLMANRFVVKQEWNKDITRIQSRINPNVASEFLDYLVSKLNEEGAEIMKDLDELVSDLHDRQEEREDMYKQIMGRVNALFEWLVTAWCRKSSEQDIEEDYGVKALIDDFVKDKYYEMAWKKLCVKESQMSHFPSGN